jgi:hypothetical protein
MAQVLEEDVCAKQKDEDAMFSYPLQSESNRKANAALQSCKKFLPSDTEQSKSRTNQSTVARLMQQPP